MARKRILLVGGAGVFGSRLAQGLADTVDADVLIAGRSLAKAHGAVVLDRNEATADDIRALTLDLVIDAAGPFQGAVLSFARACIAAGVDYIDLADGRDFVAAFPSLDKAAKTAGVRAVTGASSTPAITHAALDELTRGWTRIDTICAGISPGNRAPRGRSVVEAILSWAGSPIRVFENGEWRTRPGWSGTHKRRIGTLGKRRFALAETPDLDLVPRSYAPRMDAVFTAGLELGILHRGLGALGWLKAIGFAQTYAPAAGTLQWLSSLLRPFGSDRGGMYVEALGRDKDGAPARAEWTLVSPPVVGPFTPTLPALALARKLLADEAVAPGARACVGIVSLADLRGDFERIGLETGIVRETITGPFELALGAAFERLPDAVRAAHRQGPVSCFEGQAKVEGANALTWLPARLFGFPRKADRAPVRVTKRLLGDGREVWEREIGGARFRSEIVHAGPGRLTERFGPFTFTLELEATPDQLIMSIAGWRMGWLPLPAFLAPRSVAREGVAANGAFTFDVPIAAPLLGRLTRYKGELQLQEQDRRTT